MSLIAKITFLGPAQSGSTLIFSWTGVSGSIVTATETFKPTRTTNYETTIGTGLIDSAQYLFSALNTDYGGNFNLSVSDNSVYVSSKNTSNPMSAETNSTNILINDIGLINDLLCRSSELFIAEDNSIYSDSLKYTIYNVIGENNYFDDYESFYIYDGSKTKLIPSQNNIWFNISNLINDGFNSDVNFYVDSSNIGVEYLRPNEAKWVVIKYDNYYDGDIVQERYKIYFCMDGFINNNETQSIPNILLTNTQNKQISSISNERIYFKYKDISGITVTSSVSNSGTTYSALTYDERAYTYVNSLRIIQPPHIGAEWIKVDIGFNNGPTQSVTYNIIEDCKYTKYDLIFKNKWGVLETLPVNKKYSKIIKVESTEYLKSIVDIDGNFNISNHTNTQYNTTGEEEITLNTPFLSQLMNDTIKEVMLSNEIYLFDSDTNDVIPVLKLDESLSYKTQLNDKLIQYTIKVKTSHKSIKNII